MKSSDKLLKHKTEYELHGRLDNISKSLKSLRNEINDLRNIHDEFKNNTNNNFFILNKQIKELYSFTHKLEMIYNNGLIGRAPVSELILDNNEDIKFDNKLYESSARDLFPLK